MAGGLGEGGEALLLNCSTPVLRHHTPWTPLSKDAGGLKYKSDGHYSSQDEPLNFCKSPGAGLRGHVPDGNWALRAGSGGNYRGNLNMSPTTAARLGKVGHYGKPYRMSPGYHSARADVYMPKLYGGLQCGGGGSGGVDGIEGYCTVDGIKSENGGYESHGGMCYDGRLLPQMPIKVEQDSDSENGCDAYGRPWGSRQPFDRRYGNGGGDYERGGVAMQMKAEGEYYEQYSPCQRSKAIMSPTPFNGHYQNQCGTSGTGSGGGMVGRPLKCVLNKEPPASTQFSPPQGLAQTDPLCGSQTANCMDGHSHGYGAGAMLDHKGYGPQDYKLWTLKKCTMWTSTYCTC